MTERAGYGIRRDYKLLNWEQNEFPILCDNCMGESRYIRMLKKPLGAECKICTRPFSTFHWKPKAETGRIRRTEVCSTCAKINNCCQACIYDLVYNLPLDVRNKLMGDKKVELLMSEGNRDIFAHLANENIDQLKLPYEEFEASLRTKGAPEGGRAKPADPAQTAVVRELEQARKVVGTAENLGSCWVAVRFVQPAEEKDLRLKVAAFFDPEQFEIAIDDCRAKIKFDRPARAVKFMRIFADSFVLRGKLLQISWLDPDGGEIAQELGEPGAVGAKEDLPRPPKRPALPPGKTGSKPEAEPQASKDQE